MTRASESPGASCPRGCVDTDGCGCEWNAKREHASLFDRPADVVQIAKEYPLLWERAVTADTRDRLGQSVDPLDAEADSVLREVWMGRQSAARSRSLDHGRLGG